MRKKVLTSRTILCEVRGDTKKRDDHCEFFDNKNVQVKVIKMGFLDAIEGGFA